MFKHFTIALLSVAMASARMLKHDDDEEGNGMTVTYEKADEGIIVLNKDDCATVRLDNRAIRHAAKKAKKGSRRLSKNHCFW